MFQTSSIRVSVLYLITFLALVWRLNAQPTISNLTYPNVIGRYTVFEITFNHDDASYSSPWDNVIVQAGFTSPTNNTVTVDGFYYDVDTWKVRFATEEIGNYSFTLTLNGSNVGSGNFLSIEVGERGFIRQHPTNPFRLVYEADNSLFVGVGVTGAAEPNPVDPEALRGNTTIPGWWASEPPGALFPWFLPDEVNSSITGNHTMEEYFTMIIDESSADFTRISLLNASGWSLFEDSINATTENQYSIIKGQWLDDLIRAFRARGVRIMLDPVGDTPKPVDPTVGRMPYEGYFEIGDINAIPANERYYRYIVARYGAFVDFWELLNEGFYTNAWVSHMAQYIKSIDPYGHMVTASYVPYDNVDIDYGGFHTYFTATDLTTADIIARDHVINLTEDGGFCSGNPCPKSGFNKPIVFGEAGHITSLAYSAGPTAISEEQTKTRARIWVTFFMEAHSLFWAQHWNTDRTSFLGTFFDNELRNYYRHFHSFTSIVGANVTIAQNTSITGGNGAGARAYALSGSDELYLYIYNPQTSLSSIVPSSDIVVTADIPISGTAEWFDPSTGSIVGTTNLTAGVQQSIHVPSVSVDLAMRLSNTDNSPPSAPMNVVASNIGSTSFDLSWDPSSDNVGVASYRVFVSGVAVQSVNTTSTSITGLASGQTYAVLVTALDAAGNESGRSTEISVTTESVLAVNFLSFSHEIMDGNVVLTWEVVSEWNHSHYLIEWSPNGENWTELTRIKGSGTDNFQHQKYAYTHSDPTVGQNYYRLKAVDIDGAEDLLAVAFLRYDPAPVSVYPNPAEDLIHVRGTFFSSSLTIIDILGRKFRKEVVFDGHLDAKINVSDIPNGVYFIIIDGQSTAFVKN